MKGDLVGDRDLFGDPLDFVCGFASMKGDLVGDRDQMPSAESGTRTVASMKGDLVGDRDLAVSWPMSFSAAQASMKGDLVGDRDLAVWVRTRRTNGLDEGRSRWRPRPPILTLNIDEAHEPR